MLSVSVKYGPRNILLKKGRGVAFKMDKRFIIKMRFLNILKLLT